MISENYILRTAEETESRVNNLISDYFFGILIKINKSYCVVYQTGIHLSVSESGRYLPPLRKIIVNYSLYLLHRLSMYKKAFRSGD